MSKTSLGLRSVCAVLAVAGLSACGMHGQGSMTPNVPQGHTIRPMDTLGGIGNALTGTLSILLGDAAPSLGGNQVDAINLGVREIDAIKDGQTTVLAQYSTPKIVNVLAYEDNTGQSVADNNVSTSSYDSIRLVIDVPSSNVQIGPTTSEHSLPLNFLVNTSTASTAGAGSTTTTVTDGPNAVDMVVTQPFSIPTDQSQTVRVDFNAFESLALQPDGSLLSRPSLFVAPTGNLGVVRGQIVAGVQQTPVTNATVVAVAPDGSIGNTGFTDASGNFVIGTLRAGTYQLEIYNAYTNASGAQFTATASNAKLPQGTIAGPSVTVTSGNTTYTGTITDAN